MEKITDFSSIEQLLLPQDCCFSDDARNVINDWESKEILACPGSGKTTVLIAKLKLLTDKLPLREGRGVCVLSHTNVAVNELKAKLDQSATKLLSYPNFVGTIQSFVDLYITFPFLRQYTKTSLQVVDTENYAKHLYNLICKTDKSLKWFIDQQYGTFSNRYESVESFLENVYIDDNGDLRLTGMNRSLAGKEKKSTINYRRAVYRLLSMEGIIKYSDTYKYTQLAIKKYGTALQALLSRRFQYVFVDEYQDCSMLQREILDIFFSGPETVFQKIGDIDQSIYNSTNDNTPVWQVIDGYISIKNSNRYTQEIADVLSMLRSNKETIISSRGHQNIKPTLFVYNSSSQLNVIPAFVKEIQTNGLAKPDGIYKAIGMFENVKGLKLSDYWPSFKKKASTKTIINFNDYIFEISAALEHGNLYIAERWTRKLLSKVLHYLGIKDVNGKEFTTTSVKKYILQNFPQDYQSLILNLTQIDPTSPLVVEGKIKEMFTTLLGDQWLQSIPSVFINPPRQTPTETRDNHIFYDENGISIVFDTVYGVKGETHDATLYLETETKNSTDIKRILPLLEGKSIKRMTEFHEKSRRCVYVGFSRPRHLLALAIREDTYIGHENAFSSWKFVDLRSGNSV